MEELSKLEHKADVLRRQMEIEYYHGAFLPFDREDGIVLAELLDNVDRAEDAFDRALIIAAKRWMKNKL